MHRLVATPLALVLLGGGLGACASAGKDVTLGGDGGTHHDSGPFFDAPASGGDGNGMIDAPAGMQTKTLTEATSATATAGNSVACQDTSTGYTYANTYIRVFDLSTFGISTAFNVTKVSFAVESANGSGIAIAVRVGTYSGTFTGTTTTLNAAMISIAASNATVNIPANTSPQNIDAPVTTTIPAGSKVVVEVDSPDFTGSSKGFFIGSNTGGESAKGFMVASTCGTTSPTDADSLAGHAMDMIISVTGTY